MGTMVYIEPACDSCLKDINGKDINVGDILEDSLGFTYKAFWNQDQKEWGCISLRENNREYYLHQERVNFNKMIVCSK